MQKKNTKNTKEREKNKQTNQRKQTKNTKQKNHLKTPHMVHMLLTIDCTSELGNDQGSAA